VTLRVEVGQVPRRTGRARRVEDQLLDHDVSSIGSKIGRVRPAAV
jgi:hypothetical protein